MFFNSNDIYPLPPSSSRNSHGLITSSSMDHNNASTETRHHFYQPPHHQRIDENNDNQGNSHGRTLPTFVCKCLRYCIERKESEEATNSNVNTTPSTVQMLDRISEGTTHQQQQHNSCCGWTAEASSSSSSPSSSSSFWISQWVSRALSRSTSRLLQPSYEPIETETWIYSSPTETTAITSTSPYSESKSSPLRTASSFHCSKDVMTIRNDEIVLPGSMLQKTMAQKMFDSLPKKVTSYYNGVMDIEDECVICMDGFTEDNPRMPTHCGCGENKTYFHLPCLYHWMEQSSDCPSCRRPLTWEEF